MIVIAKLEKPYKDSERISFIVNYNHQLGYEINETDTGLEALGFDDNEIQEQKEKSVRSLRDKLISEFEWRISRNNDERELGIEETDDRLTLLQYREYLRHYPEMEDWYNNKILSFEEFKEEKNV